MPSEAWLACAALEAATACVDPNPVHQLACGLGTIVFLALCWWQARGEETD